jgi:hypothetical protein
MTNKDMVPRPGPGPQPRDRSAPKTPKRIETPLDPRTGRAADPDPPDSPQLSPQERK